MKILNLENHSPPPPPQPKNIVTDQKDFCKSIGAEKNSELEEMISERQVDIIE